MARAGAIISAARRSFGERNRTAISSKRFRPSATAGRERVDRSRARGEQSLRERRAKTGLTRRYLRTTRLLNLWERRWKEGEFRAVRGARIHRVERIAHDGGSATYALYAHRVAVVYIRPYLSAMVFAGDLP